MTRSARIAGLFAAFAITACTTDNSTLPNDVRARNTGEFPVFAPVPAAATTQLTEAEKLAKIADLVRAGDRAAARAGMPMSDADRIALLGDRAVVEAMRGMSEVERLRFLRRVHEQRTIDRIESRSS